MSEAFRHNGRHVGIASLINLRLFLSFPVMHAYSHRNDLFGKYLEELHGPAKKIRPSTNLRIFNWLRTGYSFLSNYKFLLQAVVKKWPHIKPGCNTTIFRKMIKRKKRSKVLVFRAPDALRLQTLC